MAVFRDDQIEELRNTVETVDERAEALVERLLLHRFRSEMASEFAVHGLARRINAIAYSLQRVFEALPPDLEGVPTSNDRSEATAHLQTVAFNVYGCFDNLARIWVAELDVKKPNGRPLGRGEIGLVEKCEVVRRSLPADLQNDLVELDPWFRHLEDFRHATAHRVPLYIPPFMIDPRNADRYRELDAQAAGALRARDFDRFEELSAERDALRHFRPMIATSINEVATALFHPQLLADFATVELWVGKILDSLPEAPE